MTKKKLQFYDLVLYTTTKKIVLEIAPLFFLFSVPSSTTSTVTASVPAAVNGTTSHSLSNGLKTKVVLILPVRRIFEDYEIIKSTTEPIKL